MKICSLRNVVQYSFLSRFFGQINSTPKVKSVHELVCYVSGGEYRATIYQANHVLLKSTAFDVVRSPQTVRKEIGIY